MDTCIRNTKDPLRLPDSIFPTGYQLTLNPSLKTFKYNGNVTIGLKISKKTTCIVLDVEEIELKKSKIKLLSNMDELAKPTRIEKLTDLLKVVIHFDKPLLTSKKYELTIEFKAEIRKDLKGFYQSSYKENNEMKHMAVTQFAPIGARSTFPCFDEPLFRSIFQVSMILNSNEPKITTFSNMPTKSITTRKDGKRVFKFLPSPNMPSYLLAFVVGEFETIEKYDLNTKFRVVTTPGLKEQGKFALDTAVNVTRWLNDYFQIPYHLPKMDLVAIPDFHFGAMENWGLITFRTLKLLRNENTKQSDIEDIVSIVAHEISHMWFGNLVSYSYWNELYLTEGWATLFATKITHSFYPKWKSDIKAEISKNRFKTSDSLQSSPPLIHSIKSIPDIHSIFNVISYTKGGAFYDMLNHRMGGLRFREMLRYHYKKFSFKATITNDLLTSFQKYYPELTVQNLRTWTDKAGYPLVTVKSLGNSNYKFEQKRFYSEEISRPDNKTWWIPDRYKTSKGNQVSYSFSERESNVYNIQGDWFKLNSNQYGVFRVNYPETGWKNLIKAIQSEDKSLSELDILGLTDDIFVLSGASETSIKLALDLSLACQKTTSHGVFVTLISSLREISNRLIFKPRDIQLKYQRFASSIFRFNIERLGWERKPGDSHDDSKNRELFLLESSHYENEDVIREAIRRYTTNNIPKDLQRLIYDTVVKSSNDQFFQEILEKYKKSSNENDKSNYLLALTQTKNINSMKVILELLISNSVRSQDGASYFGYMVKNNQQSPNVVWNFFKENYDKILAKYGQTIIDTRLVGFVTAQFDNKKQYNDVKEFFKNRSTSPYVSLALSNIASRMKYIDTIYDDLVQYFK
eukprot:gene6940-11103_t